MNANAWPALPYEEWRETRDTLHMYTQVIGKLRLALSPFEPEWANVPLYVTARGLTTSPLPVGTGTIDAELDLLDHILVLRASNGAVERRPLGAAVAEFYRETMDALKRLHVDIAISVVPSEVPNAIPFPEDDSHATYSAGHVSRFFHVLSRIDVIFKQHRGGFRGRTTPVQFFWGTFDLAVTRYSGRAVSPPENAGIISRFGGDAEDISAGWWPGDERVPYPAFYAYAAPKPEGIERVRIAPAGATWSDDAGEFLLPYDVMRSEHDPSQATLEFLRATYAGPAALMGWDGGLTEFGVPGPRAAATSAIGETGA